ncbi:hypothetical protein NL676_033549 [Syzygium grande]|nr:hypothetical protein NL676_033549 [Syzygium grande]
MKSRNFVDALRNYNLPSVAPSWPKKDLKSLATPSVMELSQAGAKFHVGSGKSLFDIRFSNGTLEIPKLTIYYGADVLFRNLIGFEKCNCHENYINDYIIFIGLLHPEDVEMLVNYPHQYMGQQRSFRAHQEHCERNEVRSRGFLLLRSLCRAE